MKLFVILIYYILSDISNAGGSLPEGLLSVNWIAIETIDNTRQMYDIYEGKPMNIICENKNMEGYVELSTKQKDGRLISTGLQNSNSVKLYIKATAAVNNDTIINCTVTDKNKTNKSIKQLHLIDTSYPKHTDDSPIGFEVNRLFLPRTRYLCKNNLTIFYEYMYYDEETLAINVFDEEVIPYGSNDYKCDVLNAPNNSPKDYRPYNKKYNFKSTFSLILHKETASVDCIIQHRTINFRRCNINKTQVIITFEYQPPDYYPFIRGLKRENIMLKYSDTTSNNIQYYYEESGLQNLRCIDDDDKEDTTWTLDSNHVNLSVTEDHNIKFSSFYLRNVTRTIIICKSTISKRATYLELIRTNTKTTNENTGLNTERIQQYDIPNQTHAQSTSNQPGVLAAAGVVILVLVTAVTWALVKLMKKRKRRHLLINSADIPSQEAPPQLNFVTILPHWNSINSPTSTGSHNILVEQIYSEPIRHDQRGIPVQLMDTNAPYSNDYMPTQHYMNTSNTEPQRYEPRNADQKRPIYANVEKKNDYKNLSLEAENEIICNKIATTASGDETLPPSQDYANLRELTLNNITEYTNFK